MINNPEGPLFPDVREFFGTFYKEHPKLLTAEAVAFAIGVGVVTAAVGPASLGALAAYLVTHMFIQPALLTAFDVLAFGIGVATSSSASFIGAATAFTAEFSAGLRFIAYSGRRIRDALSERRQR